MKIRVKVRDIELEYSEPTNKTDYPKFTGSSGKQFLEVINAMADKAASIHRTLEGEDLSAFEGARKFRTGLAKG